MALIKQIDIKITIDLFALEKARTINFKLLNNILHKCVLNVKLIQLI